MSAGCNENAASDWVRRAACDGWHSDRTCGEKISRQERMMDENRQLHWQ